MHVVVTSHWNRFIAIMLILIRCIDGIMHAVVKIVIGAFHSDNVDTDCGINGIKYVLVSVMSSLRKCTYSNTVVLRQFV